MKQDEILKELKEIKEILKKQADKNKPDIEKMAREANIRNSNK